MTALTLAKSDDIECILPLLAAFHAETGVEQNDDARRAAVAPLLEGVPHGAIYIAGPVRAPIGFAALGFGWSLDAGGLTATLDALYIRPGVRRRGIGSEILATLPRALAGAGLRFLRLDIPRDDTAARGFYERMHFTAREDRMAMAREF